MDQHPLSPISDPGGQTLGDQSPWFAPTNYDHRQWRLESYPGPHGSGRI